MTNILESERIILRSIRENDVDAIFSYRSLDTVARYQYWEPYTIERAKEFVDQCKNTYLSQRGEWIGLAIIHKDSNKLIGDCALKIEGDSAEVGCNISPEFQGQGFAKEVLSTIIEYCFSNIDEVKEVFGITDSLNIASIRLMQSVGMIKVPDFEERIICKGLESIEHKYIIYRKEWKMYPSGL